MHPGTLHGPGKNTTAHHIAAHRHLLSTIENRQSHRYLSEKHRYELERGNWTMAWQYQEYSKAQTVSFSRTIVSRFECSWLFKFNHFLTIFFVSFLCSDINQKLKILKDWSQCGKSSNKQAGCLLLGYEAFRVLVFYHNSKKSQQLYTKNELEATRKTIHQYLLDPGADLVVCDEGHMIKNQKSTTSAAVNKIKTKRRIVLTGTPIQNNLKECE